MTSRSVGNIQVGDKMTSIRAHTHTHTHRKTGRDQKREDERAAKASQSVLFWSVVEFVLPEAPMPVALSFSLSSKAS